MAVLLRANLARRACDDKVDVRHLQLTFLLKLLQFLLDDAHVTELLCTHCECSQAELCEATWFWLVVFLCLS